MVNDSDFSPGVLKEKEDDSPIVSVYVNDFSLS